MTIEQPSFLFVDVGSSKKSEGYTARLLTRAKAAYLESRLDLDKITEEKFTEGIYSAESLESLFTEIKAESDSREATL